MYKPVNSRHWCPLCKKWTQGDPLSIRRHEEAGVHQGSIKRTLNRAARTKDIQSDRNRPFFQLETTTLVEDVVKLDDEDVLGQYSVRGVVYLQGEYHLDVLTRNEASGIQVSLLDEDGEPGAWMPCRVEKTVQGEDGMTEFMVEYRRDDEAMNVRVEAKDLRIVAPAPPELVSEWTTQVGGHRVEFSEADELEGPEMYKGVEVKTDDVASNRVEKTVAAAVDGLKPGSTNTAFRKRARPTADG